VTEPTPVQIESHRHRKLEWPRPQLSASVSRALVGEHEAGVLRARRSPVDDVRIDVLGDAPAAFFQFHSYAGRMACDPLPRVRALDCAQALKLIGRK
jgi:hypothetical protein